MNPQSEVSTQFTLDFISGLVKPKSTILEVGCGKGELAAALKKKGHNIVGIDTSDIAVSESQKAGIHAIKTNIEGLIETGFDVILFTRSLHHIQNLDFCLKVAKEKLNPGGIVIIEDFGFDLVDKITANWYQGLRNTLAQTAEKPEWVIPLSDALAAWKKQHLSAHSLHTAGEMVTAVETVFGKVEVREEIPYLFRYFIGDNELTKKAVESIFAMETDLIGATVINGIGLRMIARA
ncbi:MAG: class I SAM-dependent methyltransferase [Bdellovibrionota bacterium]